MQAMRKPGIVALVFILVVSNLCGQIKGAAKIKAAGKLLIPTIEGKERPYKGVITITEAEILIECQEKIFQLFNEPNTPKHSRLKINTAEVKRISLQGNGVVIFPEDPLYNRYRNLLNRVWVFTLRLDQEKLAFIFVIDMDIFKDIGENEIKVLEIINKRNDPKCHLCGFVRFY